jgi:transketolase
VVNVEKLKKDGKQIKVSIFKKFAQIQEGHPGSILSIFDIVNTIYSGGYLRLKPNDIKNNDVFIMSKGHAASVQYPFLIKAGLIEEADWVNWPDGDTKLRVFANNNIPGIDVTGGSLGHGLGIAAGIALGQKYDIGLNRNIFVIISEGELYEGSIWEALLFISHHKLSRIKIILDVNDNIILGDPNKCLSLGDINKKFEAFGFNTRQIDGHNYNEIIDSLDFLMGSEEHDLRIVNAKTIKGKGVSFLEGRSESHYWANLNDEMYEQMMKELSK